jgi:YVTN family beta-propeller protein
MAASTKEAAMSFVRRSLLRIFLPVILIVLAQPAVAQTTLGTVYSGGHQAGAIEVNPATNRIYVINRFEDSVGVIDGNSNELIDVIDESSSGNNTTVIAIAANPRTNRIYVVKNTHDAVGVIDGSNDHTTDIPAPHYPSAIAINPLTNKIYVTGSYYGKLMEIDGATNGTRTISVGPGPQALAINKRTNRIYVANRTDGTVSVVDAASFAVVGFPILVGREPEAVAVNEMTNYVYVINFGDDTLSAIDGSTNHVVNTIALSDPKMMALNPVTGILYVAGDNGKVARISGSALMDTIDTHRAWSSGIVVNPVTNKIYLTNNYDYTLTTIDGYTNTYSSISIGHFPQFIAQNLSTNRVYAVNTADNTVSVVQGANVAAVEFKPLTPCRLIDTRAPGGGGAIAGGTFRDFYLPQLGGCGVPNNAVVYSLNVTVVPRGALGYLTIWPTAQDLPVVSTMNSLDRRVKANAALIPAGYQGGVSVFVSNTSDVILDINGYFPTQGETYEFYPLPPCRLVDTRGAAGNLGGPRLEASSRRTFPLTEATTCIPPGSNAAAYSLNFTAIPNPSAQPLHYLEVWPTGAEPQNPVSTLNNPTATTVANAAIVPAGTSGSITVYVPDSTDLAIDINGYFGYPSASGLSLYPAAPCRLLDTRSSQPFSNKLVVGVVASPCAPPSNAAAYAFNATVIPYPSFHWLSLLPDGNTSPTVSTLNARDGYITSNMAIVPTSNGKIDAWTDGGTTNLILDMSGYFAPETTFDGFVK